jgi:hypothetical protein
MTRSLGEILHQKFRICQHINFFTVCMAHFEFRWGAKLWMSMWGCPGMFTYALLTVDKLTLVLKSSVCAF